MDKVTLQSNLWLLEYDIHCNCYYIKNMLEKTLLTISIEIEEPMTFVLLGIINTHNRAIVSSANLSNVINYEQFKSKLIQDDGFVHAISTAIKNSITK